MRRVTAGALVASVLPLVVNAATVTRLRSLGDSCGRVQTWPNRTSSVNPTSAGAKSPNICCAPVGGWLSVVADTAIPPWFVQWTTRRARAAQASSADTPRGEVVSRRLAAAIARATPAAISRLVRSPGRNPAGWATRSRAWLAALPGASAALCVR